MRPRRRRLPTPLASALAAVALAGAAQAEPHRLALVLGNGAYTQSLFTPLPNARNDMAGMAEALKGIGFDAVVQADLARGDFDRQLAAFAAKITPGDAVIVFYAGHGVMGPIAAGSEAVDNYLVPVDADRAAMVRTPPSALGLTRVLDALEAARAGPRIVIIDACRQNLAELKPAAPDGAPSAAVTGAGLVQPSSAASHKVFLAFATSPGKLAQDGGDEGAAHNGRFTGEILRRISAPGQTVGRLFEEVSTAVDHGSRGEQVPWFADLDGAVGGFVLRPGPAAPPDPLILDLRLAREALECGLPVCLESAAAGIRSPALREELLGRAKALRTAAKASPEPTGAAGVRAPSLDEAGLSPSARAFLSGRRASPAGWTAVADRLLTGTDGFPRDEAAALRWYRAAADAGSGEAAFALGSSHRRGLAGVARNEAEARREFERAAQLRYPQAFVVLGDMEARGEGGRPRDEAAAVKLYAQGMALGDGASTRQYARALDAGTGGLTRDWVRAYALFRQAAELGDAEAMFFASGESIARAQRRLGEVNWPEVFAWEMRAAKAGYLPAFTAVADAYAKGQGVAKDEVEAVGWRLKAAERGDAAAMATLARLYEDGDGGLPGDCHQAGVWYRRAAVAGGSVGLGRLYEGRDRFTQGGCTSLK